MATNDLVNEAAVRLLQSAEAPPAERAQKATISGTSPGRRSRNSAVSTSKTYTWDEPGWENEAPPVKGHVVAYDFGIKINILLGRMD